MVYFTADPHLGHKNIISHCSRPFSTTDEMDEALISSWNQRVTENDEIYILGDLMFFCSEPQSYLERLSGRKHLIMGNHDSVWMRRMESRVKKNIPGARPASDFFESIRDMNEITLESGEKLVLCHYPMMSWNGLAGGSWLIFGHIHNSTDAPYWPLLRGMERALNAGVDVNDFRPVTFCELLENNIRFRMQHPPVSVPEGAAANRLL